MRPRKAASSQRCSRATTAMRRSPILLLFGLNCCVASLALAGEPKAPAVLPPAADQEIDFARDVRPIFARSCVSCHGAEKSDRIALRSSAAEKRRIGARLSTFTGWLRPV